MNLSSLDLNLLVVFEALMSERQVTRAAKKVGLSQPAVSNALRRLRHVFQDSLLVRTPFGMEPTARALELLGPITQILRDVDHVLETGKAFEPAASKHVFRVRMGDLHGLLILPRIVAKLERQAPNIGLDVVHLAPGTTIAALEKDELDLVISTGLEHPKAIRSERLYVDKLVCVFRTGHAVARAPMTLENFLQLRHIKIAQSPTDTRFVDDDLARRNLKRNIVLNIQHWLAAPYVVRETDLVSVMWERMARGFNADGALTLCPLPLGPSDFTFRLYWHNRYQGHPAHGWIRSLILDIGRTLSAC